MLNTSLKLWKADVVTVHYLPKAHDPSTSHKRRNLIPGQERCFKSRWKIPDQIIQAGFTVHLWEQGSSLCFSQKSQFDHEYLDCTCKWSSWVLFFSFRSTCFVLLHLLKWWGWLSLPQNTKHAPLQARLVNLSIYSQKFRVLFHSFTLALLSSHMYVTPHIFSQLPVKLILQNSEWWFADISEDVFGSSSALSS